MSILRALTEVASEAGDDWIEHGLAEARRSAEHALSDEPEQRKAAMEALAHLDANRDRLAGLTRGSLVGLLAHVASGNDEAARELYLATAATFEERRAAAAASTAETIREKEERVEAWEALRSVLVTVGRAAVGVLTTLLLGAL